MSMTHKEISELAKKAGCIPRRSPENWNDVQVFGTPEVLKTFVELIEQKVRNSDADLCEKLGMQGYGTIYIAIAIREGEKA